MKYVKTFESFNENFDNNLEESAVINEMEAISKGVQDAVDKELDKMDDKTKEETAAGMQKLADTLGLTMAEMADPTLVADAMAKAKVVKESIDLEESEDYEDMNEGFKEWWAKRKAGIGSFLAKAGLGSTVLGILTTAISAGMTEKATTLLDFIPDSSQSIAPMAMIGLVATAMGVSAIISGLNLSGATAEKAPMSKEKAASIIAARKARSGR